MFTIRSEYLCRIRCVVLANRWNKRVRINSFAIVFSFFIIFRLLNLHFLNTLRKRSEYCLFRVLYGFNYTFAFLCLFASKNIVFHNRFVCTVYCFTYVAFRWSVQLLVFIYFDYGLFYLFSSYMIIILNNLLNICVYFSIGNTHTRIHNWM